MSDLIKQFINGRLVEGTGGRRGDVYNPALGEVIRQVDFAGPADVRKAVEAASAAFPEWAQTPALRRARVMFNLKQLTSSPAWSPRSTARPSTTPRARSPGGSRWWSSPAASRTS
jgi:malonate-semialdehyde dehydrogenase (acetylating)/methylmalonate-semialdehyde dehydrogenase